jgi:hypothetical protein
MSPCRYLGSIDADYFRFLIFTGNVRSKLKSAPGFKIRKFVYPHKQKYDGKDFSCFS